MSKHSYKSSKRNIQKCVCYIVYNVWDDVFGLGGTGVFVLDDFWCWGGYIMNTHSCKFSKRNMEKCVCYNAYLVWENHECWMIFGGGVDA